MTSAQTLERDIPLKLHDRHRLAENGAPAMREEVIDILEVALRSSLPPQQPSQLSNLAIARARLQSEHPELSQAVEACDYEGVPQIELACELGISRQQVSARVQRGRALLRDWLSAQTVERCRLANA